MRRAYTSGWLALCLLIMSGPMSHANRPAERLRVDQCPLPLVRSLNTTLESLPPILTTDPRATLRITCDDVARPFGFELAERNGDQHLRLGPLTATADKRSAYRLAHLTPQERRRLWHQRALIHALVRDAAQRHRWHEHPAFRTLNGWPKGAGAALNRDPWGYSRAQGQDSALDDLVTFSEEWLARPPRRAVSPDNRIECQSFSKGRFLDQLLLGSKAPKRPSTECRQFYRWSDRYVGAEVLFSSPTTSLVSSFGHLGIILRQHHDGPPEFTDAVFQFVGLLGVGSPSTIMRRVLLAKTPLILHAVSFSEFEEENTKRQDRYIEHYPVQLTPDAFVWFKARLWEQLRRYEAEYGFMGENCAIQVARVFEVSLSLGGALGPPGLSNSPAAVLSRLQRSALLGRVPQTTPSLSQSAARVQAAMAKVLHKWPDASRRPPTTGLHPAAALDAWASWFSTEPAAHPALLDYATLYQDAVALSRWSLEQTSTTPIPVQPAELLEIKRAVFRTEKPAAEAARLVEEWLKSRHRTRRVDPKRDAQLTLIGTLLNDLGDMIATLEKSGAVHTPPSAVPQEVVVEHVPKWGMDGAIQVTGASHLRRGVPWGYSISGRLYDERQGVHRSSAAPADRDLTIGEVVLAHQSGPATEMGLRLLRLHTRSGLLDVPRLGLLIDQEAGVRWVGRLAFWGSLKVGPSVQLLRWRGGAGDLTVGAAYAGEWGVQSPQQRESAALGFITLTIPLSVNQSVRLRYHAPTLSSASDPRPTESEIEHMIYLTEIGATGLWLTTGLAWQQASPWESLKAPAGYLSVTLQ